MNARRHLSSVPGQLPEPKGPKRSTWLWCYTVFFAVLAYGHGYWSAVAEDPRVAWFAFVLSIILGIVAIVAGIAATSSTENGK